MLPRLLRLPLLALLALPLALAVTGCDRKREGNVVRADAGTGSAFADPHAGSHAAAPASAAASAEAGKDEGPSGPPPSGGPWATCADGFRISGNSLRDVTRLGLLCGPATGLRRPEPPLERTVSPNEPWAFDVALAAGECVRLFIAASAPAMLSVTTSGAPSLISTVSAREGWLLGRPRGPLCADEAATVHVVVTSAAGGNLAVGRWFLPP